MFIGINNDSSGHTGRIVAAISQHYPQVHLVNTDPEHQRTQQRGSYYRLYDVASRISSSHCMVVDMDATWVAYPFESKIGDFLSAHANRMGCRPTGCIAMAVSSSTTPWFCPTPSCG